MTVVYAAADLHGQLPDVPSDAEVVLLAGDICPDFRPHGKRGQGRFVDESGVRQRDWMLSEFVFWVEKYVNRGVEFAMTWGNHDFIGEHEHLVGDVRKHVPIAVLRDEQVTIKGVRVWGTPWVPGLVYWAFYGRPEALKARAALIPPDLDVLMTHGPPHGAGDYIPTSEIQRNKYGNFGGENVGDVTLNVAIAKVKPKAVICGHIHPDRGTHLMNEFVGAVYNCAAVDDNYVLVENPFVRLYEF